MTEKKKTVTKVARFEITGIVDEEKRLMNFLLKELQHEAWKLGNALLEAFYEDSRFGKSAVLVADEYSQKSLQAKVNFEMKKIYTKFNTSGLETISQKVLAEWKTSQKKFYKGESRIVSYKKSTSPIYVRNNQIKLEQDGKLSTINVRLLSAAYAEELEAGFELKVGKEKKVISYQKVNKGQWVNFNVIVKGGHLNAIFKRAMEGTYKIGTSQFIYDERNRKWFFNLTYSFVPEQTTADEQVVMGIDVGITNPATIAVSNDRWYREFVGDGEFIKSFRNQVEARKKRIQRSRKYANDGSVGHGVKTRTRAVEKLSGRIARFKDTENHKYSKYIVSEAVRLGAGTIQMEDLTGISEKDTFLKQWTFYDLQQKIRYKAEEQGIKVVMIKPDFTSQRCHKCGCIDKGNRETQEVFECKTCGHKANADVNAARNIATPGIEKIIEDQLKAQEQALKHQMKFLV